MTALDDTAIFERLLRTEATEATFSHAQVGLRATGASSQTYELVDLLRRHEEDEETILAQYQDVLADDTPEWAKYLLNTILEDERRHHQLLAQLANALAWSGMDPQSDDATPMLTGRLKPKVIAQIRALAGTESRDATQLHRLRKHFATFSDTTLWTLLLDLMAIDTKKHLAVLGFIERHSLTQ